MSAEFYQPRAEVDLVTSALQHRTAEVVVKDDAWLPGPVLKGMDVSAQKVLHRLVKEELQIQRRDHDNVATKQDSVRRARPTATWPK